MEEIKIEKIIRSRRRSVGLQVMPDATLVVRAPFFATLGQINSFVSDKSSWVKKKIVEAQKWPRQKNKEFRNGEEFFFLGKPYPLEITERKSPRVELREKLYISGKALPRAKRVLEKWYRAEALKLINSRCEHFSQAAGFKPQRVRITGARKRWGSCTSKGTLSFTWRLVMAPPETIDYVVVHEMAHLKHHNHSKLFWNEVSKHSPEYKKHNKFLKTEGRVYGI